MAVDLSRVSIGIKTFLRDEQLFNTVEAIERTMPEVTMIIADDGEETKKKYALYEKLVVGGRHRVVCCEFDRGFGFKSNRIVEALNTDYLLIGSDDFDFSPRSVRIGIETLQLVLDGFPEIDIASGRVNNIPYEFSLVETHGTVIEIPCRFDDYPPIIAAATCDLTTNYSLIRARVFDKVRWDDDVKIGGVEHGAFFVDVKRAGCRVGWVPGVNINEQNSRGDIRYMEFRYRGRSPERPCFDKRGIKRYVCGDGTVDYEVKSGS